VLLVSNSFCLPFQSDVLCFELIFSLTLVLVITLKLIQEYQVVTLNKSLQTKSQFRLVAYVVVKNRDKSLV